MAGDAPKHNFSDWKNGQTFKDKPGDLAHDLYLNTKEKIYGLYQMRHYFYLAIPIYAGGINHKDVERSFHYKLFNGDTVIFEQTYSFTIRIVWFADLVFGAPAVSLTSYQVIEERFRTAIVNGEATDPVEIKNTATSSALIYDYNGKPLTEDEIAALQNPSWKHTYFKTRTSEFGNDILDSDGGLGTETALVEGRIELPIYRLNIGPDTEVEIVFDNLSGAGREDRYQFRWGGAGESPEEYSAAMVDKFNTVCFGGIIPGADDGDLEGKRFVFAYLLPPYVSQERRGYIEHAMYPSLCETRPGHYYALVQNTKDHTLDEYISRDSGHTWKKTATVVQGDTQMAQEKIIDEKSGERGVVVFEGTSLRFRRSRDNFAAFKEIYNFDKARSIGLTVTKNGVLFVGDGQGILFVSYDTGATWINRSTVTLGIADSPN